jgi:hypothetical protein
MLKYLLRQHAVRMLQQHAPTTSTEAGLGPWNISVTSSISTIPSISPVLESSHTAKFSSQIQLVFAQLQFIQNNKSAT